jgi:sec-independent protein translocase protein TatA
VLPAANYTRLVPNLGSGELLIILVIVLLVFGSTKLPKLARSLGQAQNEYKRGVQDSKDEVELPPTVTKPDDSTTA